MKRKSFFDKNGWLRKRIPVKVLESCYHSGACDGNVSFWVQELQFDYDFPRDIAIRYLKEAGGWSLGELHSKTDTELAEIVLWMFAVDYADGQIVYGMVH